MMNFIKKLASAATITAVSATAQHFVSKKLEEFHIKRKQQRDAEEFVKNNTKSVPADSE
jgi:hypothetical protein